jgi:hypothetical protein
VPPLTTPIQELGDRITRCRPLQRTYYTESGMSLITVWMCVVWLKVHTLKDRN